MSKPRVIFAVTLIAGLAVAGGALAGTASVERAAWLLQRAGYADNPVPDTRLFQSEIGTAGAPVAEDIAPGEGASTGLRILASAVLPGTGEVLSGKKYGFLLMAADVFAWTRVAKYHSDGKDLSDAYYAYADQHYSDLYLWYGYNANFQNDPAYAEREGEGQYYFGSEFSSSEFNELDFVGVLPLYVSKENDRREYYENLGKWDQFIFGWDDYQNPRVHASEYGYTPADPTNAISDLHQLWVSRNRETYRDMRNAANDAYKKRDRWLYVNIGLRVFSVLETAWINGLLGGGDDGLAVLGHRVDVAATPTGPYSGNVHAAVSF